MRIAGIDFPNSLINAIRSQELVVFAGAGVSKGPPADMPDFAGLATAIAAGTSFEILENETQDRFLGRLKDEGVNVHHRAGEILRSHGDEPTHLHCDLLRLYDPSGSPRIVTTNFDLLFERAAGEIFTADLRVFSAPALPVGSAFVGIVHVHGDLDHIDSMVLTDTDFGRGYLTEGWARRFLVDLFRHYHVLFVGYSHEDPVMNYLARALPRVDRRERFVLTDDQDVSRWQNLGVQAVAYSNSDGDHEGLYRGIAGLAKYVRRGALEWKQQIEAIASRKPSSLDEEEADLIEDALGGIMRTRFFTASAEDPAWIAWIDNRDLFRGLFELREVSQEERELADWLGRKFAREHSGEVIALVGKHGLRLSSELWYSLGLYVGKEDGPPIAVGVLVKWVAILLDSIPQDIPRPRILWILGRLGMRCSAYELSDSLVSIFRSISRIHLAIPSGSESMTADVMGDYHDIRSIWERQVKPHLDSMVEELLLCIVDQLMVQHQSYMWFGRGNRRVDSASFRRSAIAPHEQDNIPNASDVLIDAARDCLEHIAATNSAVAAYWCGMLAKSQAPLLRRLSVHALTRMTNLSDDDRIDWLLANVDLHDFAIHHEVYQAMRSIYPGASQEARLRVVNAILDYERACDGNKDDEVANARDRFDWLDWLHRASPDCVTAKSALDDLASEFPEFQRREDSDLVYSIQVGFVRDESPWSVEELLSRPPSEWLDDLLAFKGIVLDGPNRDGLLSAVKQAAADDFQWGTELADLLVRSDAWESDLWEALWDAWSAELDEAKHRHVLNLARTPEVLRFHTKSIARLVLTILKDGGFSYASELLDDTNRIALGLRPYLGQYSAISGRSDFLFEAINHPAGVLAEYWLQSLALWRRSEDPVPSKLCDPHLTELSAFVEDRSLTGTLGKAVLCSRVGFLLDADRNWCMKYLLPLFTDDSDLDGLQASWHGFVFGGRLNPQVADVIADGFLSSIDKIDAIFAEDNLRNLFIQHIAAMVVFFVDNPLSEWIPKLFTYADAPEDKRNFVSAIGSLLRNMNDDSQKELWERVLCKYWSNRIQGIPPPSLESSEVNAMLNWLPYLKSIYPQAVELVVCTPGATLGDGMLIHAINQEKLGEKHPEATARLLVYFGSVADDQAGSEWYGAKEIIDLLLRREISQEARRGLEDLVARLGLT